MVDIDELKGNYLSKYGAEPCSEAEFKRIESALSVKLPDDFKRISMFYSGGLLGGISHHEIASKGEAATIVEETLRIRAAIGIDRRFVVLAEPSGSVIVLNVSGKPSVVWCDAVDARNINSFDFSAQPDVWDSYAAFFSYLLEKEESEP
ncbi:SMI1/KNR4 family protein [Pseudomonas sp. KNUC1026]|uniref:SMI1/KNR4 family protein n=1 Tax=Pseudomonas sp. KNUC1026 TaxID=2893890 RepID=UPI001F19B473|nr:SMI1/KNR4 family protein [Pseudomonas sp. KNUC1026]UFH51178.1 SMI1/KNR4 family protein [Pseudomonas sp. KNUC1026]